MIQDEFTEAYSGMKKKPAERRKDQRRGKADKKKTWDFHAKTFGTDSRGRAYTDFPGEPGGRGPMKKESYTLEEKVDFKKNRKNLNHMLKAVMEQNPSANKFEIEFLELEYNSEKYPAMRVIARSGSKILDIREMREEK